MRSLCTRTAAALCQGGQVWFSEQILPSTLKFCLGALRAMSFSYDRLALLMMARLKCLHLRSCYVLSGPCRFIYIGRRPTGRRTSCL